MAGKNLSETLLCADAVVSEAEAALILALKKHKPETTLELTNQAFSLPICSSMTGLNIAKLADLKMAVEASRSLLLHHPEGKKEDCQNQAALLDAGLATLYAEEILATLVFLGYADCQSIAAESAIPAKWCYAADNTVLRRNGVGLIDSSVPGIAVVIAAQTQNNEGQQLVRELRDKNLYVFEADGASASGMIFPLGFACRIARLFGGVKPGDKDALLNYCQEKIPGFIVVLGPMNDLGCLNAAGASNWQLPVLSTEDIRTVCPAAFSSFSAGAKGNIAMGKIVEAAFDLRSMQLPVAAIDIPASSGPAFTGERIRDDLLYTESGGGRTDGIELLVSGDSEEIKDGDVTLSGPDITDIHPGQNLPLAILVEVAGRLLQSDYEPVLERQLHSAINSIEGVMHEGQRDLMWLRISKPAARKGLSLVHIGKVIYAKLRQDFSRIIDKVQVKIFTQQESVDEILAQANQINTERDRRLRGMTDEDADIFYSCIICQSFAPHHVCVITPQRAGMCGALSWLDGKVSSEININGPNRPISKGKSLDPLCGEFTGVNAFVRQASHGGINRLGCYSLMHNPMTAGNCFEAVAVMLPLCNGFMVVDREYRGMTPSGMDFSMLADLVGGGEQTPGLVGINRYYPLSPKFFPAEGGLSRLVWMPKKLKEALREGIIEWSQAMGLPGFFEMIADETKGITEEDVLVFLRERGHPALKFNPIV